MSQADVTIYVCTSCKLNGDPDNRPGAGLLDALREGTAAEQETKIVIEPVECLGVCKRACTVAFTGPEKWTYVIADLDATSDIADMIESVHKFAQSRTGLIPSVARPAAFKRGIVSRTPPLNFVMPPK